MMRCVGDEGGPSSMMCWSVCVDVYSKCREATSFVLSLGVVISVFWMKCELSGGLEDWDRKREHEVWHLHLRASNREDMSHGLTETNKNDTNRTKTRIISMQHAFHLFRSILALILSRQISVSSDGAVFGSRLLECCPGADHSEMSQVFSSHPSAHQDIQTRAVMADIEALWTHSRTWSPSSVAPSISAVEDRNGVVPLSRPQLCCHPPQQAQSQSLSWRTSRGSLSERVVRREYSPITPTRVL